MTSSLVPPKSMVDTQPMEGTSSSLIAGRDTDIGNTWGWLVKLRPLLASTVKELEGDKIEVGREAQVVVEEDIFDGVVGEDLKYLKISRTHFEIYRDDGRAVLMDKSTNGTFVNKLRVSKNTSYQLNHGDVISLLAADLEFYCILLEGHMKLQYPECLDSGYLVGRQLGQGASAVVREAYSRAGHHRTAIKFLQKDRNCSHSQASDLMREVDVLRGIRHPCITEILEVIHSPGHVMIVMEFAAGGDLFDQVVNDSIGGRLKEQNAKVQFYQIVHALAFLHAHRVCHRDLKLENILLAEPGPISRIKVTDFGLSKKWSSVSLLETFVGTPSYMAPEVFYCSSYNCKSDCWSLGVILYMLLSGQQPFHHSDGSIESLKEKMLSGSYFPMTGKSWVKVSSLAKDLVRKLLQVDPVKRLTAGDILVHDWFSTDGEAVSLAKVVMGLQEDDMDSDRGSSKEDIEEKVGVKRRCEEEERVVERKRRRGATEEVKVVMENLNVEGK